MATALHIVGNESVFRYRFPVKTLDGDVKFTLRFRFNARDSRWRIDFLDELREVSLINNVKLVYGHDLLQQFQHIILGSLFVFEPAREISNGDGPTLEEFITGVIIQYDPDGGTTTGGIFQEKSEQVIA